MKSKEEILKSKFQMPPNGEYNPVHEFMDEYAKEVAIDFFNSLMDYERERGKSICYDERDAEDFFKIYIESKQK